MEYLYYVLVILTLLALCLYAMRIPGHSRLSGRQDSLAERARRRRNSERAVDSIAAPRQQPALQRELKNVPTPWGWKGSSVRLGIGQNGAAEGQSVNGASGTFQQWIDRLVSEKRTIDDSDYLSRRDASLRTMLEDRYGRAPTPAEVAYRPVKGPMLRDPRRPHDQMDNFPSGKTERIVSKLQQQRASGPASKRPTASRQAGSLRDIKTPWGW